MTFDSSGTLLIERDGPWLFVNLNRPACRNAMNRTMVVELLSLFSSIDTDRSVRAVILRGCGGHFCSGGDLPEMATMAAEQAQNFNRQFGCLLERVNKAPQVVICLLEGAVLGGGFGLACVSDLAIAHHGASMGLPETGLGIVPAQVIPFVVARIGLTQARRLAVMGLRFNGTEALSLGIVHEVHPNCEAMEASLHQALKRIRRCAPQANALTKQLMMSVGEVPVSLLLDQAAAAFRATITSAEGREGSSAFAQKRLPHWAEVQIDQI